MAGSDTATRSPTRPSARIKALTTGLQGEIITLARAVSDAFPAKDWTFLSIDITAPSGAVSFPQERNRPIGSNHQSMQLARHALPIARRVHELTGLEGLRYSISAHDRPEILIALHLTPTVGLESFGVSALKITRALTHLAQALEEKLSPARPAAGDLERLIRDNSQDNEAWVDHALENWRVIRFDLP